MSDKTSANDAAKDKADDAGTPLQGELAAAQRSFREQIQGISGREAWDAVRREWLGRKQGRLRALEQRLRERQGADKRSFGLGLNQLKQEVEEQLGQLDAEIGRRERESSRRAASVDVTLPGRRPEVGTVHPITRTFQEIEHIFLELGFSVAEGPEIDDDFHNFEALNFPPGHPARDEQDTFFLEDGRLLRTHTSPVQVRTMLARRPPIRVICPGRVYRHDNDLRHSPMFHQVEGLCVAEGISFAHLKGTLLAFLRRWFTEDTEIRLRPSFFPFTEPSAEVDITCPFCHGSGRLRSGSPCGTCSSTGWMEILGCGMVDPRVLNKCGVDPERYSGWAFGMGIDRVAMIRFGLPNIRALFDNDQRLLRQIRAL